MASMLSPYRLGKARNIYKLFAIFNALSYPCLGGNIVILFALRLNVTSTYIGLLTAVSYMAFFFLPLGKVLSRRFSIIKIFGNAWIIRTVAMAPLIAAPFLVYGGGEGIAMVLILVSVSIFHIIRGVGTVGDNPVLSLIASGPDLGSYVTKIGVLSNAVGMFTGFVIAVLLGRDPPFFLYSVIFAFGIGLGITSGVLIRKIPEPDAAEDTGKSAGFMNILREALSTPSLRQFIVIILLVATVSGAALAFLVVYSREVFSQSDGMISLYAVFGSVGVLMVGIVMKFLVDRLGAKPIFIMCMIISLASLVPVIFFPQVRNETTVVLYLSFLFFMMNFGLGGAGSIALIYFLKLVPSKLMVDMGILYFFCLGIAGTGGSFLAGVFLDTLTGAGLSQLIAFRSLYLILIAITAVVLVFQRKMDALGAMPFKDALKAIFSIRGLRAIALLDKLNKSNNSAKEKALLEAFHDTPPKLATEGLLTRAKSPRLAVRLEALRAIDALETLDEAAERTLMDEIINKPDNITACNSVRILGNHGVFAAIPLLRELTASKDYMLAGEAIVALAKLGDHAFRPSMERLIAATKDPRLKIMGVEAFGIYGSPNSLSILLDILRGANPPPYLRDEVVLAIADILGVQDYFYPLLVRFLADESTFFTLAMDEAEAAYMYYLSVYGKRSGRKDAHLIGKQANGLLPAITAFIKDSNGSLLSRWIMELPDELVHTIVQVVLSEAALDDGFIAHRQFRLLTVHWAAHELRLWTDKLKQKRNALSVTKTGKSPALPDSQSLIVLGV